MHRPLLPARVAVDLLNEVRAFVSATLLYARDPKTRDALLKCLFEDSPMAQGPFVQIRLPFRSDSGGEWPLHSCLKFPYPPYAHQIVAWQRLAKEAPQHTLVTTGTGSGKSECFMLPILDDVVAQKVKGNTKGVKALVVYPMNALIDDQGERLAETVNAVNMTLGLSGANAIRVGRYTGGGGRTKAMDPANPRQVIDAREALCEDPPDILLTNYRMLDFMLYRPQEQAFWGSETVAVFKYLVLDELHTFDGAQGADVACLIRRLRLKLQLINFCCVGTSATIAGDDHTSLRAFATKLFGEQFSLDSVVHEQIQSKEECLEPVISTLRSEPASVVGLPDMIGGSAGLYDAYVHALCQRWGVTKNPESAGRWLLQHPLLHKLIETDGKWVRLADAAEHCKTSEAVLTEFLDLVAWSRRPGGRPLFPLQVQIWTQESRKLGRELAREPKFVRMVDELLPNDDIPVNVLPAVNCMECGASGWATVFIGDCATQDDFGFETDRNAILNAYWAERAHILFPRSERSETDGTEIHFCGDTRRLHKGPAADGDSVSLVYRFQENSDDRIFARKQRQKSERPTRCPECARPLALRMSTVGTSLLTSVLSGAYLSHPANPDDRKLLVFNDSVQDAAHQAGYVSHRSFRFGLRRFTAASIRDAAACNTLCLSELIRTVGDNIRQLCIQAKASDSQVKRDARMALATLVPLDLWQRWEQKGASHLYFEQEMAEELAERLEWEVWFEVTLGSGLGWSLRKTGQAAVEPKRSVIDAWKRGITASIRQYPDAVNITNPEVFVYGLLHRMIATGAVFRHELSRCYNQKCMSFFQLRQEKVHLRSLFAYGSSLPGVVSLRGPNERSKEEGVTWIMSQRGSSSWFKRWGQRHGVKNPRAFYLAYFHVLAEDSESGIVRPRSEIPDDYVLRDTSIEIITKGIQIHRCNSCSNIQSFPSHIINSNINCMQYQCSGIMENDATGADDFRDYMKQYYGRPLVGTWAHAHTGQLEPSDRRRVEDAFKHCRLPGDTVSQGSTNRITKQHPVNILACTPTMELGIDIGDLSAVILRSFPRTIASTNQRLGRAGRKTGNALNMAITKLSPHDLAFWVSPESLHNGVVTPPGCEFTNRQVLWRQFNAFCLDVYVAKSGFAHLPTISDESEESLIDHEFWKGFRSFLNTEAKDCAPLFLQEFFRNHPEGADYQKLRGIEKHFADELESESFWLAIRQALLKTDQRIRRDREQKRKVSELQLDTSEAAVLHETLGDSSSQAADTVREGLAEDARLTRRWKDLKQDTYIFSALGSQGILPNYAFPEQGISFDAAVRLPDPVVPGDERPKPRYKNIAITRPPQHGLRELCPGQSYYLDGFKVPVVRINANPKSDATWMIFCCECGESQKLTTDKPDILTRNTHDCMNCGAEDQVLLPVLDFTAAVGRSEFESAQIRDNEEERERKNKRVETFINYSTEDHSEHAVWISEGSGMGVEFRTNATISHANLGNSSMFDSSNGFELCAECGAVPVIRKEDSRILTEFKGPLTRFINRHHFSCRHFALPNEATTAHVGLIHAFRSDVIRFVASCKDEVPSLEALLAFSMRVLLGGHPGHIVTSHAQLNGAGRGVRHIVTLYDDIPGGSGHLLSLMSFSGKSEEGLKGLNSLFGKALAALSACTCENGCYQCLLSYENQGAHKDIHKGRAIRWLDAFCETSDWEHPKRSLAIATLNYSVFDGYSEEFLFEVLAREVREGSLRRIGTEWFREVRDSSEAVYEIGGGALEKKVFVQPTSRKKIALNKHGYTMPDFWIYTAKSNEEGTEPTAYLYTDGRDAHLDVGKSRATTLENDFKLRSQLEVDTNRKVVTFTYQMIKEWNSLQIDASDGQVSIKRDGTKAHVLNAALLKLFGGKMGDEISPKTEELMSHLMASFVAGFFRECLDPTFRWLNAQELSTASDVMMHFMQQQGTIVAGHLTLDAGMKCLTLNAGNEHRHNASGGISASFARDWSVWWILWQTIRRETNLGFRIQH